MSFLLNRASSTLGSSSSSDNQYSTPGSSSGAVLYDADEEEGQNSLRGNRHVNGDDDDDDDDDELEAAFGDSHRPTAGSSSRHGRDGTGDGSMRDMEQEDDEAQQLLWNTSHHDNIASTAPIASGSGSGGSHSPRPHYSRSNTNTTLGNQSTLSAGGYDFEADPYERRSAGVSLGGSSSSNQAGHTPRRSSSSSNRRRRAASRTSNSANNAATGFLSILRNNIPLPARFRQYGLLSNTSSSSRRRADGNADADDDEDDEDEDENDWIVPPQSSMPGLFGGGTKNDGVFSNMTAKPGVGRAGREGHEILGGDDEAIEKEIPPAYEMAVLDAAPPYFDTTVHTSGGGLGGSTGGLEEILIEGLPLGNIFSFFWSLLVSMSFQFVGFLLTTLLSTSHAAKNGSRAGLGVTLIQYGLYLGQELDQNNTFSGSLDGGDQGKEDWAAFWGNGQTASGTSSMAPTSTAPSRTIPTGSVGLMGNTSSQWDGPNLLDGGTAVSGLTSSWMSMVLMIGGWFLLVSSVVAYLKVIRYAKALRDGISNDPSSLLERGGIPALFARITGREIPPPRERVWGLPSRPAPREGAPLVPSFSTRPPPPPPTTTALRPNV